MSFATGCTIVWSQGDPKPLSVFLPGFDRSGWLIDVTVAGPANSTGFRLKNHTSLIL
jgi:hypothetical protein